MSDDGDQRLCRAVARQAELDRYAGLWVALLDGEVVATESTSRRLASRLLAMDPCEPKRIAIEYVRPLSDAYVVGVG